MAKKVKVLSKKADSTTHSIPSKPLMAKKMADSSDESSDVSSLSSVPRKDGKAPAKTSAVNNLDDSDTSSSDDEESEPSKGPVKTSTVNNSDDSDTSSSEDEESEPSKGPVKTSTAKKTTDSDDSSSSEESSSEESKPNKRANVPAKISTPVAAKKISDSEENSSDASSAEESSEESDSDEGEEPSPAQAAPAQADKKRKADNVSAAPPKKAKLVNGSPSVVTAGEETKSIFVGRLSWNVDNDWLAQEFAECGEVESAHVQMDRNTGRSRGFGYVHFKTADAVEKALALNGKEIDGRPVNVDKSNSTDKKASSEKRAQAFGDTRSPPSAVLFVGNLSFGVNEDTLWETFGEHGDVKSVRVPTDRDTGKPKGFAYVEFSEIGAAKTAHAALQGYELDGRSLRLDFSQPRDSAGGGRGGGQGGRGGRGRGGFGGDRGRGAGRGGRGGDRGGRGRGRGGRGGFTQFEGQKITF